MVRQVSKQGPVDLLKTNVAVGVAARFSFFRNFADSYAVLLAFAAVEGLTIGTIWSGSGPVVAEVVGVEHMGSAMAVYWVWAALPAIFAQPIGLELLS